MATAPPPRFEAVWHRVRSNLLQHAVPDSRFHHDFSFFVPDFRGSAVAIGRIAELPCYQSAKTVLVTPDNCLEQLRHQALKDGKKLLVATYKLQRGFVLLDPERIGEDRLEMASWLDGMERPGIGRHVSLAQIADKVDLCVTGVLAITGEGVILQPTPQCFEIQWGMLSDRKLLNPKTPIVALAHCCQVVDDEVVMPVNIMSDGPRRIRPDFIATPEKVIEVHGTERSVQEFKVERLDPKLVTGIPPLQELQGIQMMERIMSASGFGQENPKSDSSALSADEQLGISIVDRLMKGYKV